MRRYELTDEQWALIEPLLPPQQGNGRPYRDHRMVVNAWLWILNTGSPWRDLPERFGPWKTAYNRFNGARTDGTIDRILQALQMRLDADGQIDCNDSDCVGDPDCVCGPVGATCTANADCCSNKCRGPSGNRTCR